jgi:periplasmic divalent cation tolerance protein
MAIRPARIAISTSTIDKAPIIARMLVENRLAACVNILPGVQSVYRWREKVEEANEAMLVIKTTEEKVPLIEQAFKSLHSYELPEFLVLTVEGVSDAYLKWIQASVR